MRILMLSDRYAPEARSAAHLFQDLAEALAKRGHDITVLTKLPKDPLPHVRGPLAHRETLNGVRIERLTGLFSAHAAILLRALDQFFLAFLFIIRALRGPRPDVVVVYSPPLPLAVAAGVVRRLRGVPVVLNLHDIYPRTAIELGVLKNRVLIGAARVVEGLAYRAANYYSVPAPTSRRYLVETRGIAADRVHLIYNWVDTTKVVPGNRLNAFRARHGWGERFIISYAGVMGYAQDFTSIIAAARALQNDPDFLFVLIGEGTLLERWKAQAQGLTNLVFLPSLDKGPYLESLQASDICLVPLTADLHSPAIPGKLQNIMAVARPAIAIVPADGDAAWMVQQSDCGLLVSPRDTNALLAAIHRLKSSAVLCEKLGQNGRRFAEENFRLDRCAARFEALLFRATGKQAPADSSPNQEQLSPVTFNVNG